MSASRRERATAAKVLKDTGRTLDDIAELLGVDPSTVSRWIKDTPLDEEREPGATETAARAVVADRASRKPVDRAWDAGLVALATIADVGAAPNANGAERNAGVAALRELFAKLAELGETSGIDDLRKALGADES